MSKRRLQNKSCICEPTMQDQAYKTASVVNPFATLQKALLKRYIKEQETEKKYGIRMRIKTAVQNKEKENIREKSKIIALPINEEEKNKIAEEGMKTIHSNEVEGGYFKNLPHIQRIAYSTLKRYKPHGASASSNICKQ